MTSLWNSISRVFHNDDQHDQNNQTPGDHVMTVGLFPSTVTKDDIDNSLHNNDGDLLANRNVIVLSESFERSYLGSNKATTTTITTISTNAAKNRNALFRGRKSSERRIALANGEEKATSSIDSWMLEEELSNLGPDALVQPTRTSAEKPHHGKVGSKVSNKLQKVLRLGKANISKLHDFVGHKRDDNEHDLQQPKQGGRRGEIIQLEEEPDVLFYEAHDGDDDGESTIHHHRNGVPKEILIVPESQQKHQQQLDTDITIPPISSFPSKLLPFDINASKLDRSRSHQPAIQQAHQLQHHRSNSRCCLPEDVNLNVREVKKLRLQVDEYRSTTFETISHSLPICTKLEKLVVCRGTKNPENFAHRKRTMEEMHMLFM